MKKIFLLIFVVGVVYAYVQDWQANNTIEYIIAENTSERAAEEIIRDILGTRSHRAGDGL